jgi:putative oxidoreductase
MSRPFRFFDLARTHDDAALDIIRTFLGLALFVRGVLFIADSSRIVALVRAEDVSYLLPAVGLQLAAATHLLGGLMLATGLATRLAALMQLPVLGGAVYFAFIRGGLFLPNQSLELSALVLFLLVILFIFGSGKLSLDRVLFGGSVDGAAEVSRFTSPAYREKVSQWESEQRERAVASMPPEAAEDYHAANAWRLRMVAKYGTIAALSGVALIVVVRSLPFAVSLAEIATVAGALFLILGFFFLFFGWALRQEN